MRYPPPIVMREARVRREYAHRYQEREIRGWGPAARVAELVRANRRTEQPRLPDEEFEFRGGSPRRPGLRARTRRAD
jgi:hypothetical protein